MSHFSRLLLIPVSEITSLTHRVISLTHDTTLSKGLLGARQSYNTHKLSKTS